MDAGLAFGEECGNVIENIQEIENAPNEGPDPCLGGPDVVSLGSHHLDLTGHLPESLSPGLQHDPTDIDFIAKVNDHSITVHDLETSEMLASINFKEKYNKGIENVDALFGSGFVHHH